MCTSPSFQTNVSTCILATCSYQDAVATRNITNQDCGVEPKTYNRDIKFAVSLTFLGLDFVILFQRVAVRMIARLPHGGDDWTALVNLVILVPLTVIYAAKIYPDGLGLDVWVIPFEKLIDFAKSV